MSGCCKPQEHDENMENEEDAHYKMSGDEKGNKVETEPVKSDFKRTHTDILAFALLIVMWVAMTSKGAETLATANVQALMAPADWKGRLCGVDSAVADKPYGYITGADETFTELYMECIKECPTETTIDLSKSAYDNMICQDDLVSDSYKTATSTDAKYYDYNNLFNNGQGPCNFKIESYTFITYCVFNPTAVFPNATGNDDTITALAGTDVSSMFSSVSTASDQLGEFIQDLVIARNYIFGFGFAVCLLVAFAYTWLMSMGLVRVIVWGGISITTVVLFALGGYLYLTGEEWKEDETKESYQAYGVWGLGIGFLALGGLWVAFIICICSKIELACTITEIAGNAIREMNAVVLLPLVQVAGLVLFLVPWVYYMAGVNAQGSYVKSYNSATNVTSYSWEFDTGMGNQYTQTFFMFCYFWTTQFIVAMGQLILAVAFKGWYFNEPMDEEAVKKAMMPTCPSSCCCCCCCHGKDEKEEQAVETTKSEDAPAKKNCLVLLCECIKSLIAKILNCIFFLFNCLISCGGSAPERGNMVVFGAFFEAIYYHVGTAAAGSLIIAIIKTIQYIVAKIQYEVNKKLKHAGPIKWIANAILCCIQCCLWCIEKCMKFINKHAYIITAVRGKSFCAAACDAFFLICRNIRLIGAITVVQEFSVLLGKVFILMVTGFLSYVYMEQELGDCTDPDKTCVNSLIGPTLFVMILAYFIADMFCSIYSMAIDCIMHCYLVDHEVNKPNQLYLTKDHLKELGECVDKKGVREAKKRASAAEPAEDKKASAAPEKEADI